MICPVWKQPAGTAHLIIIWNNFFLVRPYWRESFLQHIIPLPLAKIAQAHTLGQEFMVNANREAYLDVLDTSLRQSCFCSWSIMLALRGHADNSLTTQFPSCYWWSEKKEEPKNMERKEITFCRGLPCTLIFPLGCAKEGAPCSIILCSP